MAFNYAILGFDGIEKPKGQTRSSDNLALQKGAENLLTPLWGALKHDGCWMSEESETCAFVGGQIKANH